MHKLFYINQNKAYGLLFKAAGKALLQCSANPDFLGAQAGAVAILHTWGQTLTYHPHIHMIVPAGELSADEMEWIPAKKNFFIPAKAISAVYRGILCRLLEHAIADNQIKLPEGFAGFKQLKDKCYLKKWVVYCEKPFSNSDKLINYLGNYTHRVAISNQRIADYQDDKVSFYYKDYKSAGIRRKMSLDADEFIRRFLQHVLPNGFYKIRYFGFMALCNMQSKLATCFELIAKVSYIPKLQGLDALEVCRNIFGINIFCCPECKTGKIHSQKITIPYNLKPG